MGYLHITGRSGLTSAVLLIGTFLAPHWSMAGHGLAELVAGLLLLWPAFVFAEHGPAVAGARVALAAGDFAASALVLAGMLRRFGSVVRQVV